MYSPNALPACVSSLRYSVEPPPRKKILFPPPPQKILSKSFPFCSEQLPAPTYLVAIDVGFPCLWFFKKEPVLILPLAPPVHSFLPFPTFDHLGAHEVPFQKNRNPHISERFALDGVWPLLLISGAPLSLQRSGSRESSTSPFQCLLSHKDH